MSMFKILQAVSSASGATKIAQDLLEKAVSKDAQDQILTFSTRAAYLQEKVLQVESVLVQSQSRVQALMKENEDLEKERDELAQDVASDDYEAVLRELNDLKMAYEDLKTERKQDIQDARKEGWDIGYEEGREAANEDRDAQEK